MIVRTLLAVVAVVAIAWFAITWNDARRLTHAEAAAAAAKPSRAQLEQALRDAHGARLLNPDKDSPLGTTAGLNIRLGREAQARALLVRLTRLEPLNVEAWALVAAVSEQRDPALAAQAVQRVKQLDPNFQAPGQ